jgi:hypothetical protein
MSKPKGNCVFCGEAGSLTKSHVWPEWIEPILPRKATHYEQVIGGFTTFIPKSKRPAFRRKIRQGHVGTRKPRNTCVVCNGGWMRHIEEATMAFMPSLLLGKPFLLDTISQRLLATFLCLVSLRIEFSSQIARPAPVEDRDWLKMHFEPPPSWRIWIAKHKGNLRMDERYTGMQISSSPEGPSGVDFLNSQVTTLVVGEFCAHLFCSTIWTDFEGYEGIRLSRIWPPRQIDIDTLFLPVMPENAVPWLHEAIARDTTHVPAD